MYRKMKNSPLRKHALKLFHGQRLHDVTLGFAVTIVAAVGAYALTSSHAASPYVTSEAEAGSLASGACSVSDSSASGNAAINFSGNGCTSGNEVVGGTDTSCQFYSAAQPLHVAFCDGFDSAQTTANTISRSGDLLAPLWGVSRLNSATNPGQGQLNDWYGSNMTGCGNPTNVLPTQDARICNGQFVESVNDGGVINSDGGNGQQTVLAAYPRQPFDISGRTGTAVFDLTADSEGGHAAWPDWCYTDQPVPAPTIELSGISTYPRNGVCVQLTLQCGTVHNNSHGYAEGTGISVEQVTVYRNYASQVYGAGGGCVNKAAATNLSAGLNHFEINLSQDQVTIWGTNPGSSSLVKLDQVSNANLTLTRGLVWLEDDHYNACKLNDQCDHTFVWDNAGFDGPILDRDMGFDVVDANQKVDSSTVKLGYDLTTSPVTLQVKNVHNLQTPSGAIVIFNWYPCEEKVPSISVNGNTYITTSWPYPANQADGGTTDGYGYSTIAVPVPLSEINMNNATNTIAFKAPDNNGCGGGYTLANVDLILMGASPPPTVQPE